MSKTIKIIIALLALVIVIGLAGGGYYLYNKHSQRIAEQTRVEADKQAKQKQIKQSVAEFVAGQKEFESRFRGTSPKDYFPNKQVEEDLIQKAGILSGQVSPELSKMIDSWILDGRIAAKQVCMCSPFREGIEKTPAENRADNAAYLKASDAVDRMKDITAKVEGRAKSGQY